jgi:NAD(P)-dependent dehydrogenase (short-subunit alcohol dehydrogenase family)
MSFDLRGKVAVVTGGSAGIGAGIVAVLAEAGAKVVNVDVAPAADVRIDLGSEASIVKGCAEIIAAHGAPWALVNNAGIQDRQLLLEGTAEEWDRMNRVNARGPFLMTRELGRAMVAAKGGRIVNIASCSLEGQMVKGLAAYMGSKGALAALTQASALELVEHNITVNTVLPGGVPTPGAINAKGPVPEGPARRRPPLGMCEPRDIGAAVLFFVSPAARYVTNQTLTVDAGFSIT